LVEATLNYLAPMEGRPYYYTYPPPEGTSWRNTHGDRRALPILDARELPGASLDREGFALERLETAAASLFDPDEVRRTYFPEVIDLVAKHTGARRVEAFDFNVRSRAKADAGENLSQHPVRFVHNDYTVASGPQRVRDLFPDEADTLLARRFAVINVWKPIVGPVEETPLAFCDASSMELSDFVETDLLYEDRNGEIYSVTGRDSHRWYYYPSQRADEALLLKCYDSDTGRAAFTAHTAFDDPDSPADPAPRESIEVRTLAFF